MLLPILNQYEQLIPFLSTALGEDYYICLYAVTEGIPFLVSSSNNHTGMVCQDVLCEILSTSNKNDIFSRTILNRQTKNPLTLSAKVLYEAEKPIGILCILFDSNRYYSISKQILALCPSLPEQVNVNPTKNIESACSCACANNISAYDAATEALNSLGVSASRLSLEERLDIIHSLDKEGIFLIKGAVKDVASVLECSTASIYRYLTQLRMDSLNY